MSPVGLLLVVPFLACAHPPTPAPVPLDHAPPRAAAPGCPACPPCPSGSIAPVAARRPEQASGPDGAMETLIRHLNAQDADALFRSFGPAMKEVMPLGRLRGWMQSLLADRGAIKEALPIAVGNQSGRYRLEAERGAWLLEITATKEGEILGLRLADPPPPDPPIGRSTIRLGLPFRGRWQVVWGGDTLDLNHHIQHASQRRAADLLVTDEQGRTHRADGKRNRDYYAYGQEILAVADGKVASVVEGIADNEPGNMNSYLAPGNLVIIQHAPDLYSVYAHLKPASVRVHVGRRVHRGDVLGACGNSGNSSEPHLHFQLQDGPLFERSWGIEAAFAGVQATRDGRALPTTSDYTFRKGDVVVAESR